MEFNDFFIKSIRAGPEKNFSYLIVCRTTQKAALVDVAYELDKLLEEVHEQDCDLEGVLVTHWHKDHAGLVPEIVARVPDLKIYAHPSEIARLQSQNIKVTHPIKDQEFFHLGKVKIQGLHTPGHTEGGCSYLIYDNTEAVALLSGDTLFIDQCGRTDLLGGSDAQLFESLQKLKGLPSEVIVYPGHDYGPKPFDTIAGQIATNPTMSAQTLEDFLAIP